VRSAARRPSQSVQQRGRAAPLTSNRSPLAQPTPTQLVTRALGPLIPGPVAQIANLVDTLPAPLQLLLPIVTPSEVVKVAGAIADAGTAVIDAIGGLFSGGGYTQAELDRNHALVMAGMVPQAPRSAPSRRTIDF